MSNLNKEPYYVLTAGVYDSKEDADKYLASVKKVYKDAYVKFSGDNKNSSWNNTIDLTMVSMDNIVVHSGYI